MDAKTHWEKVYATKAPETVSWYRPHLETSLALIERAAAGYSAFIIDVGGVADVTRAELSNRAYDVWHDRAVFHFLTEPDQRAAYVRNVARSVKRDGHVIVSTFGPEGPMKCSGLDVVRYDADSLHDQFGAHFRLVESSKELHCTPFGTTQQFLYCYCKVE